jgi:hypothetical protein
MIFLEIEKEVGVERRPPTPQRDHFDGYFYYISRII